MPLFNTKRDIKLFNRLNKQLIGQFIDTTVIYLQLDAQKMRSNVYGQSTKKIYKESKQLRAMITRESLTLTTEDIGLVNKERNIVVSFNNAMLEQFSVKPKQSDIIQFNDGDYIIVQVTQPRYMGGQPSLKFSTTCICVSTTIANTVTSQPDFIHKELDIYE